MTTDPVFDENEHIRRAGAGDATAMVALARYCSDGVHRSTDLGQALGWAEQAAMQDAPDGYMEISRIMGSACIEMDDHDFKKDYARFVVATCDMETLHRFRRPDIAANVGTVAEYMMGFGRANGFDPAEIAMYRETAELYYGLADGLMTQATQPVDPQLTAYVHGAIGRVTRAAQPEDGPFRPDADALRLLPYRLKF